MCFTHIHSPPIDRPYSYNYLPYIDNHIRFDITWKYCHVIMNTIQYTNKIQICKYILIIKNFISIYFIYAHNFVRLGNCLLYSIWLWGDMNAFKGIVPFHCCYFHIIHVAMDDHVVWHNKQSITFKSFVIEFRFSNSFWQYTIYSRNNMSLTNW